jgi:hypothetical protein
MENIPKSGDRAQSRDKDKLVGGTGNLKHALKEGVPPGVHPDDLWDPGRKNLERTGGRPAGRDDSGDFDDEENKDRS